MTLTRYGRREWITITIIALLVAALLGWFLWWWLIIPVALIWLASVAFFRDPRRVLPQNLPPGVMLSPADGTVSAVLEVDEHEATGGPAVIVRIFLSVLDVHVNRSPCDGTVLAIQHRRGKFYDARTEESAQLNESNLITMRVPDGRTIGVRQVVGKVARRIVCPLKVGDQLQRGQRFGMIKFGSTTELILPDPQQVKVHVTRGEHVRGGLTQVATLEPASVTAPATPVSSAR